jgi:hypothetical protein
MSVWYAGTWASGTENSGSRDRLNLDDSKRLVEDPGMLCLARALPIFVESKNGGCLILSLWIKCAALSGASRLDVHFAHGEALLDSVRS